MTRVEAEKLADERNQQEPDWFCPLINGDCNKRCVNFERAFAASTSEKRGMLHDVKDENFEVLGFICTNQMYLPTIGVIVQNSCKS